MSLQNINKSIKKIYNLKNNQKRRKIKSKIIFLNIDIVLRKITKWLSNINTVNEIE